MRVHLRSGDVGMSQNGLDGAEVSAVADHVGGATVAQHVRTRLPVGLRLAHDAPHSLARKSRSGTIEKDQRRSSQKSGTTCGSGWRGSGWRCWTVEQRTSIAQIAFERIARGNSEGND